MRWQGRRQSDNIEDRRGGGFGGGLGGGGGGMRIPVRAGGGGIGIIVVALVLWLVFGINPLALLGGMDTGGGNYQTSQQQGPGVSGTADTTDDFVATVLADTEDVWGKRFQAAGETYPKPTLVLFDDRVQSACGIAGSATGPFYCPNDRKLYLDLSFFRQLKSQLGAPGDFAQAYVIAHEVGHHVQNLTGTLQKSQQLQQSAPEGEANAISVRTELQADCYAGIWAHDTQAAGYIEDGDINEALNAAQQIGDDTLQRKSQGVVVPDSFTHGTSAQRQQWFRRGYESGKMDQCDTFSGGI
ncbi:KPN_02809 family neutral zinc metallopeptidase [Jiella sonneratiae]|uniref:Zinc metallopeptidase n=1 Tax=Jiella sonneratiae TaxID=2816856 RepID=A0ABS3J1W6_9HYPH|nr:neutral zinc metallopeptidase [Jiella sonneratiae]MBO0903654.1 zinc metallopeptidase [Jiella sonneratiae]